MTFNRCTLAVSVLLTMLAGCSFDHRSDEAMIRHLEQNRAAFEELQRVSEYSALHRSLLRRPGLEETTECFARYCYLASASCLRFGDVPAFAECSFKGYLHMEPDPKIKEHTDWLVQHAESLDVFHENTYSRYVRIRQVDGPWHLYISSYPSY